MSLRRFATGAALAIAGLMAAAGIGLLANSISGDNVGLSAEPLSAGETLAPTSDERGDSAKQRAARERARKRAAARRRAQREAGQPADAVEVPAPGAAPTTTTFDDHGGLRDGGGSDDNSGSGSTSSGSGSGSGGSDDSLEIDDD
jgi:hypothetical protein